MIKYATIYTHACNRPDSSALIDQATTLTWSDFADRVAGCVLSLGKELNSRPDDSPARIAFLAESTVDVVVLQAAAATLGVPAVGIDHSLPPEQVGGCLSQIRPSILAVSPAHRTLAEQGLNQSQPLQTPVRIALGPSSSGWPGWAEHVKIDSGLPPETLLTMAAHQPQPFESLGFTSGTSGQPKMVIRSKSFDARRHKDVINFFDIGRDDVYLNTVPLFHASAGGWARVFLTEGAPVVIASELPSEEVAGMAARYKVSMSLMVPGVLRSYVNALRKSSELIPSSLRALVTGGRQISPVLLRETGQLLGQILFVYYGTTETGLNTLATPADLQADPTTVGAPLPGNDIVILGADDEVLQPGQSGTVVVSSYMLADRFANGDAPVVQLGEQAYWRTSDTGRLDADGHLYILGRDINGESIDVITAEGRVLDLPCVQDACLHVTNPERPRVLVTYVPRDKDTPLLKQLICDTVTRTLGTVDLRACSVNKIPYSPSGKVRLSSLKGYAATAGEAA